MMKTAIATKRSDFDHSVSAAIKAANSNIINGVERCIDILRYLKSLNISSKDLCHSNAILPLESLRKHKNPKIRMGVNVLFTSWMKTLYSGGRDRSSCNKAIPLIKPANLCLGSQTLETGEIKQIDASRPLQTRKQARDNTCLSVPTKICLTQTKPDVVQVFSKLKKTRDQRPPTHETKEIKQNLKKKQSALPMKRSETPKYLAHETGEIKRILKKSGVCKSVSTTSRPLQMKKQLPVKVSGNPKYCPALKKNSTEMLELFEIAKKSADVANAKGLLTAKTESSICVDTLSLLISLPISSTATETRRIMEKLERLTKHKDRRICHSASQLFQHWRQSIRDQQHKDARKTQG